MLERHKLLAGAAIAVLFGTTPATATTEVAASTEGAKSRAAPFAQSWAHVPRTASGRKAKSILVFGVEQDVSGFNTTLACCDSPTANDIGASEALHGAFRQNTRGVWFKDLVSKARATKSSLSYTIRPNAYWYWGGRKLPVTYEDFVYTLQKLDDPASLVADRTGYGNIDAANWSHTGLRQVTFHWKTKNCSSDFPCGPYGNWQSLFSSLYPAAALADQDFNKIWTDCICGSDGKPVSNGPFYLSNYTKGQGSTLKTNPFWAGTKPGLGEIDFKIIADSDTEVQAMRKGEVDAITPTFGPNLLPLRSTPGVVFTQVPGYTFEHLDFRETSGSSNPLLRSPWMRQAIGLGIDRQGIVETAFGALAGNAKPLNNLIYSSTQAPYRPDFAKWSYRPAKALSILRRHCSGGPSTVGAGGTWTCSGYPARFRWSWASGNSTRAITEAIVKQELKEIGIEISDYPRPAGVLFGPAGLAGGDFDIAEYALVTAGDPGDRYDSYGCGGRVNYTGYCSARVTRLMQQGIAEPNPGKRTKLFQTADRILASTLPEFPLYQQPDVLIYRSGIVGMKNSPASAGPFWNIEDWRWKS